MKHSPGDIEGFCDPLQAMLGFQLRRTNVAAMSALAEELAGLGLNASEASMIVLIGANPGCTQSEIGRALRAKPANLVPLVNALSTMEALERVPGKGRTIALTLSDKGRKLCEEARQAFARHEARIGGTIPPEQRDQLIALLRQIVSNSC